MTPLDRRLERLEARQGRHPDTTPDAQREGEHAALDREIDLLLAEMARREGITPGEAFARIVAQMDAEDAADFADERRPPPLERRS